MSWNVSRLAFLTALVAPLGAWAQAPAGDAASYPSKPTRIIIALAPGGGVDTSGRMLGQRFTEAWGQQYVADNRPGAGGTIASAAVAKGIADGGAGSARFSAWMRPGSDS